MSAYTPACLAWHVLCSCFQGVTVQRLSVSDGQVLCCLYGILGSHQAAAAACFSAQVCGKCWGENKHKAVSSWLTQLYWPYQKVKRIGIYIREMFEFHEFLPTSSLLILICGVKWDTLSVTSCWNVNKAALCLTSLDLPFQLIDPHIYTQIKILQTFKSAANLRVSFSWFQAKSHNIQFDKEIKAI